MSLFDEFQVEDGTGLSNATSYVSVEDCLSYLLKVGNRSEFADFTPEKTQSILNQASQYLDINYCFLGSKKNADQSLEFPRDSQVAVPLNIRYAIVELAFISNDGNLFVLPGAKNQFVTEQKVGPITQKFASSSDNAQAQRKQTNKLDYIEDLIKPFLFDDKAPNITISR